MAELWTRNDNAMDYKVAQEKGEAFGVLLNSQVSGYSDIDVFDYSDDEEDGI